MYEAGLHGQGVGMGYSEDTGDNYWFLAVYLEQSPSLGTASYRKLFESCDREESETAFKSLERTLQPFADIEIPDDLLQLLVLPQPKTLAELPNTVFDYILQRKADNSSSDSLLHYLVNVHIGGIPLTYHACSSKKAEQNLKILFQMGADVQCKDQATGNSLVHVAAMHSHSCLLVILNALKKVCNKEQYLKFINAVNHDNLDSNKLQQLSKKLKHSTVSIALEEAMIVSLAPCTILPEHSQKCAAGVTPLMLACYKEHIKSVGVLLTEGADPNKKDPLRGTTALRVAVAMHNVPIIQLLLAFDAELDCKNDEGETTLDFARKAISETEEEGYIDILKSVHSLREKSARSIKKPETSQSSTGIFILGVDGGGTRLLIPAFILHFLEKRMSMISNKPDLRISHYFNWLSGTSAGSALILAMIYNHSTPAQVLTSVIAERDKLFSGSRFQLGYSREGLEDFVKGVVGDTAFIDEIKEPKVIVPTTLSNCSPPKCILINNYPQNEDYRRWKVWEAVRASAAAPTYFPAFEKKYVDGGLMVPNPTLVTMTEALQHSDNQHLAMVLSLGTGTFSSAHRSIDNSDTNFTSFLRKINIKDRIFRLVELLTANLSNEHTNSYAETWCHTMGTNFYRLSPNLHAKYDLDNKEDPPMAEMLFDTYIYCLENSDILETIALQLLDHGPQHNH